MNEMSATDCKAKNIRKFKQIVRVL